MKAKLNKTILVWVLCSFGILALSPSVNAQEKAKPRLSVEYKKVMGSNPVIFAQVKYKDDKTYLPGDNILLNVYWQVTEDSLAPVGEMTTNAEGEGEFQITFLPDSPGDTVIQYEFLVKLEKNDRFKKAKKAVKFMTSFLTTEVVQKDSINYVSAQLVDGAGEPMVGEDLAVKVERLFAPINLGKSSYETDDDGRILVAVEEPIPSKTGELVFNVIFEGRKYGTVKSVLESNIGMKMDDLSTFDQRTMWSPIGKTPIFLLVFANILIFGIWIVIFILVRNLFKIKKL